MPRRWMLPASLFTVAAVVSLLPGDGLVWQWARTWPSALMNLPQLFILLPAALAGWGAWRGGASRRSRFAEAVATRSSWRITASWLAPALAAAVVAPVIGVVRMAWVVEGTPRVVDLSLVVTSVLLLVAWSLLGFVLGRVLPVALAVPVAALAGFVGMAFPEATNLMALRHVLALHSTCCLVSQEVSTRVLVGSLVFYLALVVVLGWLAARTSWRRVLVGVVVQLVVAGVCLWVVAPVTHPNGTHERPLEQLVCRGEGPRICLWPEQEPDRVLVTDTARRVADVLTDVGVPVPGTLSAASEAEWSYQAGVRPSPLTVQQSVVTGVVAVPMPACARTQPWHAPATFPDLASWLWQAAGYSPREGASTPKVSRVLARPLAEQRAWFAATMSARTTCGKK